MGKKKSKKSKQDARGYCTTAQLPKPVVTTTPKPTVVVVEDVPEVSPIVKKEQQSNDDGVLPLKSEEKVVIEQHSKRWLRKIEDIHDKLIEYKFTFTQIEMVVQALGEATAAAPDQPISLTAALDWLCLNLSTEELPPLFTEQQVRDKVVAKNEPTTVQVLAPTSITGRPGEEVIFDADKHLLYEPTSEEKAKQQEEKSVDKSWILSQYEFEQEGEHDSAPVDSEPSKVAQTSDVSPEELRLQDLERQVDECRASVNDEASNYMRSKQEIKELRKELKQLEGQANKLRTKVAKQNAAREKQKESVEEAEEDDEEYVPGFGLFDSPSEPTLASDSQTNEDTPTTDEKVDDSSDLFKLRSSSASIPQGWTGTTPKIQLEEWSRKQKIGKPTFSKVAQSKNGCSLRIKGTKPAYSASQDGPFYSYEDAQHFASTQALYQLAPGLPLYRIFPPVFRDLWKSWLDQKEADKVTQKEQERGAKHEIIQHLIKLIPDQVIVGVDPTEANERKSAQHTANHRTDVKPYTGSGEVASKIRSNQRAQLGTELKRSYELKCQSKSYRGMLEIRSGLPMSNYRDELLSTVAENSVTVLCAETGAGKTTQGPQFLLEESLASGMGHQASILCTQPRRISAMSVAERVADEMCVKLGDLVGYQIRGDAVKCQRTRLLFCTTGVVLRRLQEDPILRGVTTVVVDEVHERSWQIDFLLIALRRLLQTSRPDLKVLLMSATLDAELFCSFFGGAPLLNVPGRTFPVANYFLEDLLDATDHTVEEDSMYALREWGNRFETESLWVTGQGGEKKRQVVDLDSQTDVTTVSGNFEGYKMTTQRSMDRVDEKVLNYDLIEDVLIRLSDTKNDIILPPSGINSTDGAILIFLPGLAEIRTLSNRLTGSRHFGDSKKFDVIPLHSALSQQDQKRAFAKPRAGCRKIILSTNIAETSVTIPDVVCVIDSGLVREIRQDKRFHTSKLVLDWCSKASIKQRAGRAGRVQEGICCRLFSSRTSKLFMKDQTTPELQRVPLEEVCLSILAGRLSAKCVDFLMEAPQPPPLDSVQLALNLLKEVGAIEDTDTGQENLTTMGQHMAKIPLHVRLSKMVIVGVLFRCLDPILTIVASLSVKSPFITVSLHDSPQQIKSVQSKFRHQNSDFMSFVNLWKAFSQERGTSNARGFCRQNYISWNTMMEIHDMRRQNLELLYQIGLLGRDKSIVKNEKQWIKSLWNENSSNETIIHAVCCAGLFPNVASFQNNNSAVLQHRHERLYFHSTSVNHGKTRVGRDWIVFFDKFAGGARTTVSATCPISPLMLVLFATNSGSNDEGVVVKHVDRKVVVDGWMELSMAAQSALLARQWSSKLSQSLLLLMEEQGRTTAPHGMDSVVKDVVTLLTNDSIAS